MHKGRVGSRLLGQWFHVVMGFFVFIQTPFLAIIELFLPVKSRGGLWRAAGAFSCRAAFFVSGIRIVVHGREHTNLSKPAIYAANHGCPLDGFILSSVLGNRIVLFTAPLPVFPKPVAFWMRKMEVIDVRRDKMDDVKYPGGHSKRAAFVRAKRELGRGNSVIIFPEGHIQYLDVLHYFHTGASRLSAMTRAPIVPSAMINTPELVSDKYHMHPGTITVRFGAPLAPPATIEKKTIRAARDVLEKRVVALLPSRYIPAYYGDTHPHRIAVFIDIDNTMYQGITMVDLMQYLFELHKVRPGDILHAGYWLFLEKTHQLSHPEAMNKEFLMLGGWHTASLHTIISRVFKRRMIKKCNYFLYTLLKDHAEAGHAVVFVTETIHPIAREFKKFLHARATLDTTLQTEVRHHHATYTGRITCLCYGEKKAELVSRFAEESGIDLSKSYGYGDSVNDAPFLKLVGHPVVVNPDTALTKIAEDRRWAFLPQD